MPSGARASIPPPTAVRAPFKEVRTFWKVRPKSVYRLPLPSKLANATTFALHDKKILLTCWNISEVQAAADSLSVSRATRVVRFCIHVPKHDHTAWEKGRATRSQVNTVACCASAVRSESGRHESVLAVAVLSLDWKGREARGPLYGSASAPRRQLRLRTRCWRCPAPPPGRPEAAHTEIATLRTFLNYSSNNF